MRLCLALPQQCNAIILTESICVLNPIDPSPGFRRRRVHVDVVEHNIRRIHHVDGPELGLHDVEVAHIDVADVPQDKGHRATGTRGSHDCPFGLVSFVKVPDFAVAVDASGTMTVDPDVVSCQDEPGRVVLELDVVGVGSPILEIFGELVIRCGILSVAPLSTVSNEKGTYHPLPVPIDIDVVYFWVQAGVDVIGLVLREDNVSSVATLVEGFDDCWDVVGGIVSAGEDGAGSAFVMFGERDVLCSHH